MIGDHSSYFKFTTKSRLETSINSLLGIVEGISVDSTINGSEAGFLRLWLAEHEELKNRHPFNELMPVVEQAILDDVLSVEERQDILWLCERLRSTEYFDAITADIQRLHAVLGGIASDGIVTEAELRGLSEWLFEHEHLRSCWPYDEVDSLVTSVMRDQRIDELEQRQLQNFFSEFIAVLDNRTIVRPLVVVEDSSLVGLYAVCPEISFQGTTFCFTGASSKYIRKEFASLVRTLGGGPVNSVSAKLNYLVIGADGNPCWAYACYGRKGEKAVELRRKGSRLLLVHENDFRDAIADLGLSKAQ